ncbi:MAG: tetraacyldisaccharide 4'-kinase [Pseudomonadota bacterium]|nr:tetraacyldisaccharide 4'-kinase [Pseudomonadota bacterium]
MTPPGTRRQVPVYWYGDAPVPLHARLLSALYAGVTGLRRRLYAMGVLRSSHPGVPVVVVGNITAGGAGKTPLTIALVQRLRSEGWNPGIATRGYARDRQSEALWVDAGTDPLLGGDEPCLLARRTGARVRADRDRAAAARELTAAGCDVIVCDDGLQHYRLRRDIEIEVVDGRRRYGNGQLLPAGPLRELPERGTRCDFRIVNAGGAEAVGAGFGEWPMRLLADQAMPLAGGRPRGLASFCGQRVHAVAGIGDPERFFTMLRKRGIAVVPHAFPDHHRYAAADFDFGSHLPVLMTEKDALNLPKGGLGTGGPAASDSDSRPGSPLGTDLYHSVPVTAELPEAFWIALLDRLSGVRGARARGA